MLDISESIKESLLHILKEIENEDQYTRLKLLKECKQNELYWHGFQHIFWDEGSQDFKIPTHTNLTELSSREETKYIYDYVVNVFKAHGLSIIAALSSEIPGVPFSPMDADNQADVIAARKAETLGKVIHKYNKSKLIFYQALFTLFTSHYVAAYNHYERDEKYGTAKIPKYKKGKISPDTWNCTDLNCPFESEEEFKTCPECSSPMEKIEGEEGLTQDGMEDVNKGMEKVVIKGTLNVKLPIHASDQAACGYLVDYSDQHYAWIRNNYPHLDRQIVSQSSDQSLERLARLPSTGNMYEDNSTQNLLTLKRVWIRPWMYDILDEEEANELKEEYPKGCYFAVVDSGIGEIAEVREEKLDDHWTITKGDLSRTVYGDPIGKPLIPMQDLENMVMNLLVESLEHSVPSTFADPEILDFDLYSKQEIAPGAVYPAKNGINPNKRMEDYFYTLKTSTLPKEGVDFGQIIESKGQFVVGAFPSIFGGPQTEGSKTLGEYQESRSYALQRLSIPYQLLFFWWADVTYKSVKDYISNMIMDEKHSIEANGQTGKYSSVSFLMDEFASGAFSNLLPEAATDLPVSFSQKRSTLQGIIQLNSDVLNQFLFSPENKRITLRYLGMEELSDADSNQSMKQLSELDDLLKSTPIPDELTGEEQTSLPTEPEIDDDDIHLRILKTFLSGDIGRENKKSNPEGYKNALLHARMHQQAIQMKMMEEAQMQTTNTSQEITKNV